MGLDQLWDPLLGKPWRGFLIRLNVVKRLILTANIPICWSPRKTEVPRKGFYSSAVLPSCLVGEFIYFISSQPYCGCCFHPEPTLEPRFFCCLTPAVRALFLLFLLSSWSQSKQFALSCSAILSKTPKQKKQSLWTRPSKLLFSLLIGDLRLFVIMQS